MENFLQVNVPLRHLLDCKNLHLYLDGDLPSMKKMIRPLRSRNICSNTLLYISEKYCNIKYIYLGTFSTSKNNFEKYKQYFF